MSRDPGSQQSVSPKEISGNRVEPGGSGDRFCALLSPAASSKQTQKKATALLQPPLATAGRAMGQ